MEKIKRLLFLSAMIVALVMSSCSSEKHKKYIPADSKVLGKIDVKAFFEQTGTDVDKLMKDIEEYLGDDAASIKESGIDVKVPIYVFGHGDDDKYCFGLVAKVDDLKKVKDWLEENEKKVGVKIDNKEDGFEYGVNGKMAIGLNEEALVLIGVTKDKKYAEDEIQNIMNKELDGDLDDNNLMKKIKETKSYACLYADLSLIPEKEVKKAVKDSPEIKDSLYDLRKMIVGIDGTCNEGICDFELWAESDDEKVQEKIDKWKSAYKSPTDKGINSLPEGALVGFATNVDGEKMSDLLENNIKKTKLINMFSEEQQIIFDTLLDVLDGVNGNVAGYFSIPANMMCVVESKKDISQKVAELLARTSAATEFTYDIDDDFGSDNDYTEVFDEGEDDVDYTSGFGSFSPYIKETSNGYFLTNQEIWFGYNNGAIYFTNNDRLISSAFKKADDPIPSNLSSFIEDHRYVLFFNIDKANSYSSMLGEEDKKVINAFSEVIKNIKYLTISMK